MDVGKEALCKGSIEDVGVRNNVGLQLQEELSSATAEELAGRICGRIFRRLRQETDFHGESCGRRQLRAASGKLHFFRGAQEARGQGDRVTG